MRIAVKEKNITATLTKLQNHLEISKLSRSIANIALAGVQRNFIAGGRTTSGASGAWPKLAASTLQMRRGKTGAKPLQDTRALMNGIHPEFSGNKITIATGGQVYDAIQHFGGTTRPTVTLKMISFMWNKWQDTRFDMFANIASKARGTKLTVKIPPRPYLMITDGDIAEIKHTVLNFT
jgi:phage gpG-like protein